MAKKRVLTSLLLLSVLFLAAFLLSCSNPTGSGKYFTVSFEANGGEPVPAKQSVEKGGKVTRPGVMSLDGYYLSGWFKDKGFSEYWNFENDIVTENTTLYAKWNLIGSDDGAGKDDGGVGASATTYTVTFNSNGGTAVTPITVTGGLTINAPPPAPTTTAGGATLDRFRGWYEDDVSFTQPWDFGSDVVTADITLYADWGYRPGDTGPGGGIVFYRDDLSFTMTDNSETVYYLEAAPGGWFIATAPDDPILEWASVLYYTSDVPGTTNTLGAGRKNSSLILGTDIDAPAAKACDSYSNNGKTDWFLPSQWELYALSTNSIYVDNLSSTVSYYSSTQAGVNYGWAMLLINSVSGGGTFKYNARAVRPVRAF